MLSCHHDGSTPGHLTRLFAGTFFGVNYVIPVLRLASRPAMVATLGVRNVRSIVARVFYGLIACLATFTARSGGLIF